MKSAYQTLFLTTILAISVAACGGGGSGSTNPPPNTNVFTANEWVSAESSSYTLTVTNGTTPAGGYDLNVTNYGYSLQASGCQLQTSIELTCSAPIIGLFATLTYNSANYSVTLYDTTLAESFVYYNPSHVPL